MKQHQEAEADQSRHPRYGTIYWNNDQSRCVGVATAYPDGRLRFTWPDGQTMEGCPESGAVLRILSYFGAMEHWEILVLERLLAASNACNLTVQRSEEPA